MLNFTFKHCGFYLSLLRATCECGDMHTFVACACCGEGFDIKGNRVELVPALLVTYD